MGADALAHVLRPLAGIFGEPAANLLVGLQLADDAAVYRLNDEQAIVATTDFFPPVVDDPYAFGAIAATNALSDIWAMGGEPLFCLNLVGFPEELDAAILGEILRGGAEKVREAGAVIAGGHSVTDHEPKYGLAAIGLVHPDRIFTKGGIQPGDVVLLTKPLGTGVITTALKREAAQTDHVNAAVASMMTLNGPAARALRTVSVHACTDITGFGLLGHAYEMASQSNCALTFRVADIPWLPGALAYAEASCVPGGTARNAAFVASHVSYAEHITPTERLLLCDPQTSGGLLAAIPADQLDAARAALDAAGVPCFVIGSATAGAGLRVE